MEQKFVEVKRRNLENMRPSILERDGYKCRYCGSKEGPFHIDHVYPVGKGGETTEPNLVTACIECNRKKSDLVGLWPRPIGFFDKNPNSSWGERRVFIFAGFLLFVGGIYTYLITEEIAYILFSVLGITLEYLSMINKKSGE